MNTPNLYQPPESKVDDVAVSAYEELAGRWERLGASIIDAVFLMCILFPAMFVGGYFGAAMEAGQRGEQVPFLLMLTWAAIGFALFIALQGYPLSQSGQTWGKKLLKIKIVTLEGAKPQLTSLLMKRYLPIQAINLIPIIGGLLNLVNVLLIFRDDRRCGHDLIAGTRVVKAG
jgi:uncharacterized RDD family membrane protein YckC